jgi:hypothetical protein
VNEIKARELLPSDYKEWDLLVEKAQAGTIFHTSEWLSICRDILSIDLQIYGCFRNGDLVGGCPIFVSNFKGILRIASSTCNMTDYCGPLIKESASSNASKQVQETHDILNALREFLCRQGFDSIHLKLSPGLMDVRPFTWNGWESKVHYTYYLDMKENIDNNISRKIKLDLKSASKAGLQTRVWNDQETYYGLFSKVFEIQNLKPPLPKEFFERIFKLIQEKDIGYMYVCETPEGEVAAAHLNLYGKNCNVSWSSARNLSLNVGANAFIIYNEFLDLQSRNFEYMNVMSANVPRFADYIRGFSPKLIPYYSVTLCSEKYSIMKNLYEFVTETAVYQKFCKF